MIITFIIDIICKAILKSPSGGFRGLYRKMWGMISSLRRGAGGRSEFKLFILFS
jgi:hypothetical protein